MGPRQRLSSAAVRRGDLVCDWIEALCCHVVGDRAGQPLVPEQWQRQWIREVFGPCRRDGRRKIRTALLGVPRKNGKDLACDTPILTAGGWQTMGTIQVGDQVHSIDGSLTEVTATSNVFDDHDCYRVEFADGQSFVAGADHEWVVWDRWGHGDRIPGPGPRRYAKGRWVTLTTAELAGRFDITNPAKTATVDGRDYHSREFRYAVHADRVLKRPHQRLPIDPYVLGYWLGDGHSAAARFTVHEDDWPNLAAQLSAAGYTPGEARRSFHRSPRTLCATAHGLQTQLRALGVLGDKHVPQRYLLASAAQRLALLQGLMDSDGSQSGGPRRVEFCSTNEHLARSVLFLARSLGWKATFAQSDAVLNGAIVGLRSRVCWSVVGGTKPFRLARKADRLPASDAPTRSRTNKVVSVERCPTVPTRCIQVAHESGQFLAGEGLTPTHNSTLAAALALYMLFADGEPGAEIYSAAGDARQARAVFDTARRMVQSGPLHRYARVRTNWIEVPATGSVYRVLSADGKRHHGLNPHGVVFDELHVQPNNELWEALTSGQGARSQPLTIAITTAGFDRQSICFELYDYGRRVASGQVDDPTWHFRWYGAGDRAGHDWTDPKFWAEANPNLGVSIQPDFLQAELRQALEQPSRQNTFRRLYGNEWTSADVRWLDLGLWDANAGLTVDEAQLAGRECFGGLDLASTSDFAALVWLFPDGDRYDLLCRFWLPRSAVERRTQMRPHLEAWERDGWLTVTDGDVIDYDAIRHQVDLDAQRFAVREIAHDPWNATQLVQQLADGGLTIWPVRQTITAMTGPSKELERLLGDRLLRHGGNPVLRWMADNVTATTDSAGNIKPDKKKSTEKIDGIVATVNAIAAATGEAGWVDVAAQVH